MRIALLPSFGDRIRIRRTAVTEAGGIAGLEGQIYGETVPSLSGVQVLGPCPDDFALNVYVEERASDFWLAPEHVELIDHAAGTEIQIAGKRLVRRADGGWRPHADEAAHRGPFSALITWLRGFSQR
ncbi:MAG TPA: hypothetical protein VNE19_00305 [Methylomirabilota bacterium]|nr:hypothetical protein [Methylomirabilota bacterium]